MRGTALRGPKAACTLLALSLALAAAGCAKHAAPNQPLAQLPPQVVATSPPARGLHVPTDAAIWAQFDRPLDPSTVDTRHVFLKIDTRRLPIAVSYDAANRRVLIDAGGELGLFATHTVEFRPGLKTADGDSLGQTYFWQFTTLGVRRPGAPYPDDRAGGESPFAELLWRGTETTAGPIFYELFTGADSGAVAARTSMSTRVSGARYLPGTRWPQDAPLFWSVRVTNQNTGDQSDGPVWRFDLLPASTPIDSVTLPLKSWFYDVQPGRFNRFSFQCSAPGISVGDLYDNLEHWDFGSLGPGTRLAGSSILVMPAVFSRDGQTHGLQVFTVRSTGTVCIPNASAPYDLPVADRFMAAASLLPDSRLFLQSDALTAFAEAVVRHGELDATLFRANSEIFLMASKNAMTDVSAPRLILYFYRTGPRPTVAARR